VKNEGGINASPDEKSAGERIPTRGGFIPEQEKSKPRNPRAFLFLAENFRHHQNKENRQANAPAGER